MQTVRDGDFFRLVRITGPTHNFLSLRYGKTDAPHVAALDPGVGNGLSDVEVKRQVLAGVSKANKELNTSYQVKEIQFLRGDSPPEEMYCELAFLITTQMNEIESKNLLEADK